MGALRKSLRQHILLSIVSLIIPQRAWLKNINKPGMPAGTSKHRFAVTFVGAIRYAQIFNRCRYSFNPRPRGPPARDKPNPTARVLVPFSWAGPCYTKTLFGILRLRRPIATKTATAPKS